jgi:insulysin
MRPSALLGLLGLVLAAGLTAAPLPELPPRVVAPTDTAVFHRFVLENGLRVLVVSDRKFNKSGAALVVHTGQVDDPPDREGMAHFLEHMLFLGTEKYPEVSEYDNFIQANGGYSNAYTASDHTNYQFEIRPEAFPEALDRFAQFFIAPKFSPEYTAREIFAVHNESMRHVQNDFLLLLNVSRELYAPGSGERLYSTGNKDTLAGTTPAMVRAFHEAHYSSDRMALAVAGRASPEELERLVRERFAAVPRRNLPELVRRPGFLPRREALRLTMIEPVKELRQLTLEFALPATRPHFAAKPDELLSQLLTYAGPGGLTDLLKREGLANGVSGFVYDRTQAYGSLFVVVSLTPEGQERHRRVLELLFGYVRHLREAPFPADFRRDRARIAALNETYQNRGEGADLAARLATQALFFPLEVAERAAVVWGAPDEAAYRGLLAALTPDNVLVSLQAKGVAADRKERIYGTAYSHREDAGEAFRSLVAAPRHASFALPGANPFMPGATTLLPERALPLVNEPALHLHYAADTEFQRPQTSLVLRFVPVRALGTAPSAAALALYEACLSDVLDAAAGDAALAGLETSSELTLEGLKLTITGFGDSPVRFARHIAGKLRAPGVTPARFADIKEIVLRGMRSYPQTEAYLLARARRDALAREVHFLPDELLKSAEGLTLESLNAFGARFFGRGRLEALVHGHLSPEDAEAAARDLVRLIGFEAARPDELLRRRNLAQKAGENVVDAGEIAGVNAVYQADYLLPDDSARTRAAAVVIANFIGEPFYTELRTKQQLGYIVGSGLGASVRQRSISFVVQSSEYPAEVLQKRAEVMLATLPAQLAAATDEQWATLVAGARAQFEEKAKGIAEKADQFFVGAYTFGGEWNRREQALAALATLTRADAAAMLGEALDPERARRRTVLLWPKERVPKEPVATTFTDRAAWKAGRVFGD